MPAATDLLLGPDYDLAFTEAGDLAVGASDSQHLALLFYTYQGEWKADPLVGIGLRRYLNAPLGPAEAAALNREASIQFTRDGFQVLALDLSDLSAAVLNAVRP
ncbi:hypothetical protein Q5H93_21780 [Hymenobacter sp. ASUV-10]|uniref:Uncharacterized protein n=1 Tax=Hymenobacter aranciens TaxID=3063996 RepID=A0ABT9BGL0_9BACT|nr:hypothetical protein [Hymenobacter sp. ASUV-10]MDO7877387.1 hypothetical protein [Hymenobacter sp. ASUV-10]